jgi:DNA processing protein
LKGCIKKTNLLVSLHQVRGIGWHTLQRFLGSGYTLSLDKVSLLKQLRKCKATRAGLTEVNKLWGSEYISSVANKLANFNVRAITILCKQYPKQLLNIDQPPHVLYIQGDSNLLSRSALAIVGTRKPTQYGARVAQKITKDLVKAGLVVVSGLALGIDQVAHQASLEVSGSTVAVLATSLDIVYPKQNQSLYKKILDAKGAIVSEMPFGTAPCPGLFPRRNRIISGLALGTLVVQAPAKSGALITALYSLEQGREVFAIPGPIDEPESIGGHNLLKQGAKCTTCAQDILEEIAPLATNLVPTSNKKMPFLNKIEQRVITYLETNNSSHVDPLFAHLSCVANITELQAALLALELKGLIKAQGGGYFSPI